MSQNLVSIKFFLSEAAPLVYVQSLSSTVQLQNRMKSNCSSYSSCL